MSALDDFRGAIVAADAGNECFIRAAVALGDENVTGAAEIFRGFAQGSAW